MQILLQKTYPSSRLFVAIGIISLAGLIFFQAFGMKSAADASSRDEFPGRRQGGGTHWVLPTSAEVK
ncbi:MAG: hypothetical protein ACFCVD_14300 [Nodosilinea sp.]